MRIDKAKQFIMENARAYERALYRYFFQNGSKDSVIKELRQYQNSDGGFGHGLEADNWNPNSNPIATNDAVITLYRIGALEKDSEIVQSIISYLYSHDSFDESQRRWLFAIDSNKDYPHAFWWEKRDDGIHGFNPTVSLATLCVCFGNGDEYYREIVQEAFDYLNDTLDVSGDALKCFLLSYEMLRMNSMNNVIDLEKAHQVRKSIFANLPNSVFRFASCARSSSFAAVSPASSPDLLEILLMDESMDTILSQKAFILFSN